MYNGQYHVENDKVLLWQISVLDHSNHELWAPCMWFVPLDRCFPACSVRDKTFQKVTNWSALVPEIGAAQFLTVLFIGCSMNVMNWAVGKKCVCGLGTTNSQYVPSDLCFLTSSEMSVLHASHIWNNKNHRVRYSVLTLLTVTRNPEEITKQKPWVRRTKGFCLGDFWGGFGWTEYRTSVVFIFILWFLEFISSWGTFSACHLRFFTSYLLRLNVDLNCLSLDNHLVSKQPQLQCHLTMTSPWEIVTKQILNPAGWDQIRRDQNEWFNHYLGLIRS